MAKKQKSKQIETAIIAALTICVADCANINDAHRWICGLLADAVKAGKVLEFECFEGMEDEMNDCYDAFDPKERFDENVRDHCSARCLVLGLPIPAALPQRESRASGRCCELRDKQFQALYLVLSNLEDGFSVRMLQICVMEGGLFSPIKCRVVEGWALRRWRKRFPAYWSRRNDHEREEIDRSGGQV